MTVLLALPTISGTPVAIVTAGTAYGFLPAATGAASFGIANKPSWANFDPVTGALTGTPGNSNVGAYTNIVISAVNGTGTVSLPPFSVTVVPPIATISGTPAATVTAGNPYSFIPSATGATSFGIANKPSWAGFDAATGALTGTPGNFNAGTYSDIVISAINSTATVSLQPFSVTVLLPLPTISGTPAPSVTAGNTYVFVPSATGAASFGIANKPSWANFDSATGSLSGTPGNSNVGTYSDLVISAVNGIGTVSLPPFSVTVVPPPPTISGTPVASVTAGKTYGFIPTANGATSFGIANKPSWANFDPTTGALTGTPGNSNVGAYANIVISAVNATGSTPLPSFTITVVAQPPAISGLPATAISAGQTYKFTPTAVNATGFSIAGLPSWASFSTSTGTLSGTPSVTDIGTDPGILIGAINSAGTAYLPVFSIIVDKIPTISGTPATSVNSGGAYSFIPTATGASSFTIAGQPSWANFDGTTGALTGTPGSADAGTYSNIVIGAVNATGTETATHPAFSIKVSLPTPTISGSPTTSAVAGTTYSFRPTATNATSFSITGQPSWASFDIATGTLTGTPTAGGTFSGIVISALNSSGKATLATFSIKVTVPMPTISGTPLLNVTSGNLYSFTPTATGAAGFSIAGKPSWAEFSTTTGALTGTPSANDAGMDSNIVVSAVNGAGATASLPTFAIRVGVAGAPVVSDLNGDGKMDIADVLMVLQYTVGNLSLTPEQKALADVAPLNPKTGDPQGDGTVDMADVIMLLRRVVGVVSW